MDTASNALGLLQLVLKSFNQIQLARDFESEFHRCQLKLDLIQLRLSRWGEVYKLVSDKINSAAQGQPTPDDEDVDEENPTGDPAISILIDIRDTVDAARQQPKERDAAADQPLDPDVSLGPGLRKVRNRLKGFVNRRALQTAKVVDGMKWAFYKRERFDKFIEDVSSLTEGLEKLIPQEDIQKLRELSNEECKGINKPNLEELKAIAQDCDPIIQDAADEALKTSRGGAATANHFTQSHNTGIVTGFQHGTMNISGTRWGRG